MEEGHYVSMDAGIKGSSKTTEEEEHYVNMGPSIKGNKETKKCVRDPEILVVAAIDFGTTYSGVAYSFVGDYNRAPLQIEAKVWSSSKGAGVMSHKTPTVLLLDSAENFEAFGYEAEEVYAGYAEENAHHGHRLFKNFKMVLHDNEELKRNTEIKDEHGHPLSAMTVFSKCIKYIKDETMKTLEKRGNLAMEDEVRWVITVPAIWGDSAKQFMREAAENAGMCKRRLVLALEPETASIYAKESLSKRKQRDDGTAYLAPYDPGTKYMVVDLGGGTVDITVRQVLEDRSLREILQASGGAWGGMTVNAEFYQFIRDFVGPEVMDKLRQEYKAEYLDLERDIEMKKRKLEGDRNGRINIQLPAIIMDIYEELNGGEKLTNKKTFESAKYAGKVDIKRGHLRIDKDIIAGFFKPSVDKVIQHLSDLMSRKETEDLEDIILVGGFAESKIIADSVAAKFCDKRVIVPEDTSLAVLKGAVLYGHNRNVVKERVSKFTYGTRSLRYFMSDIDPPEKRIVIDNVPYCGDCFQKVAEIGKHYLVGVPNEVELSPVKGNLTQMSVDIYRSTESDPEFVTDESCKYIGNVVVNMPDTTRGTNREAKVRITFGDTELLCEGIDEEAKTRTEAVLNTLS